MGDGGRSQAFAELCDKRGMRPVKDTRSALLSAPPTADALRTALASAFASADFSPFQPIALPIDRTRATYENRFVSPDSSLAVGDASSQDGRNAFTLMMFPVLDLNLPYLVVARKGDVDISTVTNGQLLQFESIDFDDRFAVRANDRRSAVMLIDQGMMQWLLDCDHVNFQAWGGLVFAFVRRRPPPSSAPVELELLFRFHDGFASHVPEIVHSEFRSPRP
jgi:hypothetical protein